MRSYLIALPFLIASAVTSAQTPTALSSLARSRSVEAERTSQGLSGADSARVVRSQQGLVAANNPWLVAGDLSIKPLVGDASFSEQCLFTSTKITHEVDLGGRVLGGMRLPAMANLAAIAPHLGNGSRADSLDAAVAALASSSDGINVGVYPYWTRSADSDPIRLTLFGAIAGKLNSFTDTSSKKTHSLPMGRFAVGSEVALGRSTAKPLTVSAAVVFSTFGAAAYERIFNERRSHLWTGELTAIVPLKTDLGVLVEGIAIQNKKPSFRVGLLLSAGNGGTSDAGETPGSADVCSSGLCLVTVSLDRDASEVTISASADAGARLEPTSCPLKSGARCPFRAGKDAMVTLTLPSTHKFVKGGGCDDKISCQVKMGTVRELVVGKA